MGGERTRTGMSRPSHRRSAGLSVLAQHHPLGCDTPCQEGGQFWALAMSPTLLGSRIQPDPGTKGTKDAVLQSCLYPGGCQRYPDQAQGFVWWGRRELSCCEELAVPGLLWQRGHPPVQTRGYRWGGPMG